MQEADALHIGDIYMSPECIFFGCKHDLKFAGGRWPPIYLFLACIYRTEANGLLKRTS